MPSFDEYKTMLGSQGKNNGQARKLDADKIMEARWYNDVATRRCYLFDYNHDPEPLAYENLTPDETMQVPVDLRYIVNSYQTLDKDNVSFHIMFKPSEEGKSSLVPYYEKVFHRRYDAIFPCGLYVLIPDDKGVYNKWIIVAPANSNDPQFPTYEVLRCDKIIQWIYNNTKYQMCGVLRSQNSYNSGVWLDYKVETIEDVQKFILPLTRDTEHLYYNVRLILDNKVLTEPRAWRISKINRISQGGITKVTLAQDRFDQNKDYIEFDEDGEIIGMWADYYSDGQVEPQNPQGYNGNLHSVVSYSGTKPEIKIQGSYKKLSVKFYEEEQETTLYDGSWSYAIRNGEIIIPIQDVTGILQVEPVMAGQIKIKFIGDDSYIGKVLIVTYSAEVDGTDIVSQTELNITTL